MGKWKPWFGLGKGAGFYKRGCQEKTLLLSLARKKFPDIQPLYATARLSAGACFALPQFDKRGGVASKNPNVSIWEDLQVHHSRLEWVATMETVVCGTFRSARKPCISPSVCASTSPIPKEAKNWVPKLQ
jgi:hypothetical protein